MLRRFCSCSLFLLFLVQILCAQQNPNLENGLKPFGSYHGGDIDSVSLTNGNLYIQAPFYSLPQRGKVPLTFYIKYNVKNFKLSVDCAPGTLQSQCNHTWRLRNDEPFGVHIDQGFGVSISSDHVDTGRTDGNGNEVFVDVYKLKTADGSEHPLADTGNGMRTIDGSGFYETTSGTIISRSGMYSGGMKDSNGNYITQSIGSITDTLGRNIPAVAANTANCPALNLPFQPVVSASIWNLPAPNGGTMPVLFCAASVYVRTNFFFGTNSIYYHDISQSETVLQSIVFPNGTMWTFEYDAADPNNTASYAFGDLLKITLPTEGSISYTWTDSNGYSGYYSSGLGTNYSRSVASRTVDANDGTGPHTWNYTWGAPIVENSTTYTVENVVTAPLVSGETTRNDTVHVISGLFGGPSLYETQTRYYQGSKDTGTLLKTVNTEYSYNSNPFDGLGANENPPTATNVAPMRITTTWPNGKTSKVEMDHDSAFTYRDPLWGTNIFPTESRMTATYPGSFGVVTARREYDYGSSAASRQTFTTYLWQGNGNYLTANLLDLPASVVIKNGAGTRVAETDYGYDDPARLFGSAITTQHTAAPGPVRGNRTSESHWLSTSNTFLNSYTNWYDTGEVYQNIDPKGHTTTYSYSSSFAGAYPTQITNALSQSSTVNYDFGTGLKISETDANNQTTTYQYDNMLRLTSVVRPDVAGGAQGQTNYAYSDAAPFGVTITNRQNPSPNTETEMQVDGLGRLVHTILLSDTQPIHTDITYDELGRKRTATNPYRSTADATYGLTTYTYDPLGRTTKVQHPDGTYSTMSYAGAATQVTDEGNGTQRISRISQSDALGRLLSACEVSATAQKGATNNAPTACGLDIAGTGFLTSYQYDTLDNLTSVTQPGLQTRTFTYDSLSRLITASNPESGTTCYGVWSGSSCINGYDADGNLIARTRPAPNQADSSVTITTTYTYDALHRLISEQYSDLTATSGTPTNTFDYDKATEFGLALANTVGRRSGEWTTDGSGNQLTRSVFTYDPVGKVTGNWQCTPRTCGTSFYNLSYGYDLGGNVLTATNGVGNTFTSTYDDAGRLLTTTSSLVDSNHPGTLFTSAQYGPLGGLTDAALGNISLHRIYNSRGWAVQETDQGNTYHAATTGSVTATINFTEQTQGTSSSGSVAIGGPGEQSTQKNTPGTGNVSITGSEQSKTIPGQSATPGTGSVTISGSERTASGAPYPCGYRGTSTCTPTIYDSGYVSITVNGFTESYQYQSSATSASIASGLVSLFNGDAASPVTAALSGSTVLLTSKATGTASNYPLSASSYTSVTQYFTGTSFPVSVSGSTLTGGVDAVSATTVYDSGTVSITVNGFTKSASFGQGSTNSGVASALSSAFNGDGASPVTASISGSTVYLTSKATGSASNYTLSSSKTWNSSNFTSSSFTGTASGANLTGGANVTVYDSGSVSITVNGFTKSTSFGQTSTSAGLASALASAFAGDAASPVNASAGGSTVTFTSKQVGSTVNYPLSTSVSYDSADFSQSSFTAPPSGSTMTGGTSNGITDSGTVTMTVNSSPALAKTVSYGSTDTASTIASKLASAFTADSTSAVSVTSSGSTLAITAKQTGSAGNYGVTFAQTHDAAHFTSGSFVGPTSLTLAGGTDSSFSPATIYNYNVTSFAPNGNIRAATDSVNGTWSYTYDDVNRLVAASSTAGACAGMNLSWGYDRYGNRWNQSASGTTGCSIVQPNLTFNGGNNRIDGYTYDAAGNVLNDGAHSYTYDAENRVIKVDGGAAVYTYDAEGRRVKQVASGTTREFLFDLAGRWVTELNGSTGSVNANEIYSGGRHLASYSGGTTTFHLSDWLGTERVGADANGVVSETCRNYPFGDGLACSGAEASRMHFTGKEHDVESGLDYFGARYYSGNQGRFQTPDWADTATTVPYASFGDPQSLNLYAYVRNNPMTMTDPGGHAYAYGAPAQVGDVYFPATESVLNSGRNGVDVGWAVGDYFGITQEVQEEKPSAPQPNGLNVSSTTVLTDCAGCDGFGIKVSITYQLTYQGKPLEAGGFVMQEKLSSGSVDFPTLNASATMSFKKGWHDIGPTPANGNQRTTNAKGQFTDAPLGMTTAVPFVHHATQELRAVGSNGKAISFGKNKLTVTSGKQGHGKIVIDNKRLNIHVVLER